MARDTCQGTGGAKWVHVIAVGHSGGFGMSKISARCRDLGGCDLCPCVRVVAGSFLAARSASSLPGRDLMPRIHLLYLGMRETSRHSWCHNQFLNLQRCILCPWQVIILPNRTPSPESSRKSSGEGCHVMEHKRRALHKITALRKTSSECESPPPSDQGDASP